MANNTWDPEDYRSTFGFVTAYGGSVVELLDARAGERILDLGCGTGEHAAGLARAGVEVVGIDSSEDMIAAARAAHPGVTFSVADAVADDPAFGTFDAVLSNAALHWMSPQSRALAYVRGCLRPGGRFVAEMGGIGNVARIRAIYRQALDACGLGDVIVEENWFPSIAEESTLLADAGFEVTQMALVDRPTPLDKGSTPADWCAHFRARSWGQVPPAARASLRRTIDELAEPVLRGPDGWWIDYRRLRFVALAE